MPLSESQLAAVQAAQHILKEAGVSSDLGLVLEPRATSTSDTRPNKAISENILLAACSKVQDDRLLHYQPPLAQEFTRAEISAGKNEVNRQAYIDSFVEHPLGAIVEFPETGKEKCSAVGHLFNIEPQEHPFRHPKLNIQYSLGDTHGGRADVYCRKFLTDIVTGEPVPCTNAKYSCKGLKVCEQYDAVLHSTSNNGREISPAEEVFQKTLAFYCILMDKGCSFDSIDDGGIFTMPADEVDSDAFSDSDSEEDNIPSSSAHIQSGTLVHSDCRRISVSGRCSGKMVIKYNEYGRVYVQCQYRSKTDTAHLIIRNLDEFDTSYLRALIENDTKSISTHEIEAKKRGYGPHVPCGYTASPSSQKQLCPHWHRLSDGKLQRGTLKRHSGSACSARFDIYTPSDLKRCPKIFVICRGPHSHLNPFPVKTPPPILDIFLSLLRGMDWRLADATPRNIMVDSGFMSGLKEKLQWTRRFDPALSDLHPSLGNMDHVRRYINDLRVELFPHGTGFKGAQLLVTREEDLPHEEQYVRCAEKHTLKDGKDFYLVICMSPSMSRTLMAAKFLSIDTSFKRLHHKWQEFEIETWDVDRMCSIVVVRAFTTSQSAEAHLILFMRIFHFAELDTGFPVRFHHIHGVGFLLWIADAHKGQGLGLGKYCQFLCRALEGYCRLESTRKLKSLSAYDHLRRFFRLCMIHFKRNIRELGPHVPEHVKRAMESLASSEPHPDLEGAFQVINDGGPKAQAWLKDKRVTNKFALPALYQPLSLIPLDVWKASPSTTNGNEQSHRNINRDGVNLTILGGIMLGMHYDSRLRASVELHRSQGIYSRDQESTRFRRLARSVNRHVSAQRRTAHRETLVVLDDMPLESLHPPLANSNPSPALLDTQDNIFFEEVVEFPLPECESPQDSDGLPSALQPHDEVDISVVTATEDKGLHRWPADAVLSGYSELEGALDPSHRGKVTYEPFLDAAEAPAETPLPYDPSRHLTQYSSLL